LWERGRCFRVSIWNVHVHLCGFLSTGGGSSLGQLCKQIVNHMTAPRHDPRNRLRS
jgi:hypothetical protein